MCSADVIPWLRYLPIPIKAQKESYLSQLKKLHFKKYRPSTRDIDYLTENEISLRKKGAIKNSPINFFIIKKTLLCLIVYDGQVF